MGLPPWLPTTRAASIDFYRRTLAEAAAKGQDVEREARRRLGRQDLFFLLTVLLHRRDLNKDWLFDRCREVQAEPDGYLDLWAREHYKSTIITFGLTIQDILNDPEITVGLLSFTRPIAKKFLRQIKQEFEANDDLRETYPDVLWQDPRKEAPKWSEDEGIVVRRAGNPKEATVEAWGLVDSQPTGAHFKLRVYDDTVEQGSVTTPEMISKTTAAWELSDNLAAEGGRVRYVGTVYHHFDTYSVMAKRGVPVRKHPATVDGTETGEPVLLTRERLAEKRTTQGPYTFAAQQLLNPTADKAQGFREGWLQYWPGVQFANLTKVMIVDPASKKKKGSDYTSIWVIGIGGDGNYYQCDLIRDRLNLTGRTDAVFSLHRKWKPRLVGYEEYGLQADIEHVQYVQEQENYRFDITPLGGRMAKEDRIRRLVPIFENKRFFLIEGGILRVNWEGRQVDVNRAFVDEEYLAYPVCAHDDALDALSRLLDEPMKVFTEDRPPAKTSSWRDELTPDALPSSWTTA